MTILYLAGALAFAVGCDIYDVVLTERGIKAGVAVEAFDWLVGSKPTAVALYLRDSLITAFAMLPAIVVGLVFHNQAAFYGCLAAPVVLGIKHIRGGRAWTNLLAGGKPASEPQTWWQKLLRG
jgi:hypothetical protein